MEQPKRTRVATVAIFASRTRTALLLVSIVGVYMPTIVEARLNRKNATAHPEGDFDAGSQNLLLERPVVFHVQRTPHVIWAQVNTVSL